MKVSVIMPIFNCEDLLERSIRSILEQNFKDFEFILLDDGSTDKTLDLLYEFKEIYSQIKILRNLRNRGLTKSLNICINEAKGEYIARLDCDDYSNPDRLKLQVDFLDKNPLYAFCGTDVRFQHINKSGLKYFNFEEIKRNLLIQNCFFHSTIMIRKDVFEKYGLYDENFNYAQDYELWCRLIYKYKLKSINLPFKTTTMFIRDQKLYQKKIKFLFQKINSIRTKIKYLKYMETLLDKFKSFLSIFNTLFEIFLFITIKSLIFIKRK